MQFDKMVFIDAAEAAARNSIQTAGGDDPWASWFGHEGSAQVLPLSRVRELMAACPDSPAGLVWKAKTNEQIALAEADVVRAFDSVEFDRDDWGRAEPLYNLAEELGERSPMFALLWAELERHSAFTDLHQRSQGSEPVKVWQLMRRRGELKDSGLDVRCAGDFPESWSVARDPYAEPEYTDWDLYVHFDGADMDALVPGTWERVRKLLIELYQDLPPTADSDDSCRKAPAA